ncbi:hypothetical protein NBH20_09335 [Rhizobium sp. S153]|uniref:Uncharacterized protein n=1 Tax=Ciceribacter sichuanensis TaxID=2949647 RepID=A0ABT0V6D5_9HYPH|nr:hypothetical protein [Ciceribacter sp. S153]MCM2401358.1 hypothetical protein [Ciceribacter sp. S153]
MTIALYADYVADLRSLFTELDRSPEQFQTFDVRLELAAAGGLIVYEARRRKGLTDSLYYGRSASTGANQQISQATAFAAIDRFLALGQFIALAGDASQNHAMDAGYPHCAVNFSYRKKGHPKALSMLMVFIGFNDDADALAYAEKATGTSAFVTARPCKGDRAHEWK